MNPKEITRQLRELSITPRTEWVLENRVFLLSQIASERDAQPTSPHLFFLTRFTRRLIPQQLVFRTMGVMMLFLIVGFGGYITTVSASADSLPGDVLYRIKRIDEEVRINLVKVVNIEKAGELELAYAFRRIEEAEQIVSNTESSDIKKEKVKQVVDQVIKHVEGAQIQVQKLNDKGKTKKASALASKIDKEAGALKQVLAEKQEVISTVADENETDNDVKKQEVIEVIDHTSKAVDKIAVEAVDLIVKNYVNGGADISTEEVFKLLNQALDDVSNRANALLGVSPKTTTQETESQATVLPQDGASATPVPDPTNGKEASLPLEDASSSSSQSVATDDSSAVDLSAESASGSSVQTQGSSSESAVSPTLIADSLNEARKLLESGNVTESLKKIREANAALDQLETRLSTIPVIPVENNIEENPEIGDNGDDNNVETTTQPSEPATSGTELESTNKDIHQSDVNASSTVVPTNEPVQNVEDIESSGLESGGLDEKQAQGTSR